MKREYPQHPIVAVGGVIFQGDTMLLVKRGREPSKGQWSLPGGAVELGETMEQALRREIYEEVSIEIRIGGLVGLVDRIVRDPEGEIRFHYVIADYWGWLVSGRPRPGSDIREARFVSMKGAQKMGIHREVQETIRTAWQMRNQTEAR